MRTLIYLVIGIIFGITMFKSEAASWFRIYEMFKFDSFHMYGIIISAIVVGVILVQLIKRFHIKSFYGETIQFNDKNRSFSRYMFGGIIFGLGWALAGACPGPMFTLVGVGIVPILIVIIASVIGTFLYGLLKDKLPH
ncbi:MAG: YeeE/YedE family protein [Algicola sp.]|nr:YeeE/YedE family protein [Algicola sp.]